MDYQVLTNADSMANLFLKGVILWRHVKIFKVGNEVKVDPFNFKKTDKGSWMARVKLENDFWEPEIVEDKQNQNNAGIVVFVKDLPQDNWTHLIIEGVSKKMREPGIALPGSAIFAKAAIPYDMIDYEQFRLTMAQKYSNKTSIEDAIQISLDNYINNQREGDKKLIAKYLYPNQDQNEFYHYAHIWIPDVDEDQY